MNKARNWLIDRSLRLVRETQEVLDLAQHVLGGVRLELEVRRKMMTHEQLERVMKEAGYSVNYRLHEVVEPLPMPPPVIFDCIPPPRRGDPFFVG